MWSCFHVMPGVTIMKTDKTNNTSGTAEQKDGSDNIIEPWGATFPPEITDAYCLIHFYLESCYLYSKASQLKEALIKS